MLFQCFENPKIVPTLYTLHMLNVMNTLTLTKGGLEGELRHYRRQQAYVNAIPAMNMLGNSILKKIIATRPSTLKQL